MVQLCDFLQRIQPILPALPYAHQDTGGKGNPEATGQGNILQTQPGIFSRRAGVGLYPGSGLQHQPHGSIIRLQPTEVVLIQQAGIGVGQKAQLYGQLAELYQIVHEIRDFFGGQHPGKAGNSPGHLSHGQEGLAASGNAALLHKPQGM